MNLCLHFVLDSWILRWMAEASMDEMNKDDSYRAMEHMDVHMAT